MNVLVTGGGGFLGRAVVRRLLDRGYAVSILGRSKQPDLKNRGVSVICADLTDYAAVSCAVSGVDAVFHVAAKAGVWGSFDSFYQPNVVGTQNIINACVEHRVHRLVYTSTPSVVFNGKAFKGENETLPYGSNWLCHYAHTKAIAEDLVLKANSQALKTVALRPHIIWGLGDPHIVPKIIQQAKAGRLKIVGDALNLVDITHVENAAHAHVNALDALEQGTCCGKAYFLSQGDPVNLWSWVNELLEGVGLDPIKQKISLKKAYRLGAILEFLYKLFRIKQDPPMTRFVAVELAKDHYYSIENAKKDLGYTPAVTTQEGMRELIDFLSSTH